MMRVSSFIIKILETQQASSTMITILVHIIILLLTFPSTKAETAEVYTTSSCNYMREETFRGRIDLHYFYMVQFKGDIFLEDIERVIALTLASALDSCDPQGYPSFGVEASHRHVPASGDLPCPDLLDSELSCIVVRGVTPILVDSGAPNIAVEAYDVIAGLLNDGPLLGALTGIQVSQSEFVRSISENFVILNNKREEQTTGSTNAKLAVIASSIAFFSGVLFFYVLYRSKSVEKIEGSVKAHIHHLQHKRRSFFREMYDDSECPAVGASAGREAYPSVTWSVSDLTNDSQSIKSSLPLDRIDEDYLAEEEHSNPSYDEEAAEYDNGEYPPEYCEYEDFEFALAPKIDTCFRPDILDTPDAPPCDLSYSPASSEEFQDFELQDCWLSFYHAEDDDEAIGGAPNEMCLDSSSCLPDTPRSPEGCQYITDEEMNKSSATFDDSSFKTANSASPKSLRSNITHFLTPMGVVVQADRRWLFDLLAYLESSKTQKLITHS